MAERRYTKSHEWITLDDGRVGITDYAQSQLGDVVFLELPEPGRQYAPGDTFGVIESVKAASDLYAPVAGKLVEVNERLKANPELVNADPYGEGWLIRLEMTGEQPAGLLDEAAYSEFTQAG